MQKYSKLLIVLPCHSLEDFPIHHQGAEAENLLANWTAIWHPVLIASTEKIPQYHSADNPDVSDVVLDGETEDENGQPQSLCLCVIPTVANKLLDSELLENLESKGAVVIDDLSSRNEIVQKAIEANPAAAEFAKSVDPEIAKDFFALGYAYLQTQIMTRQLRYSSNLNEAYFGEALVDAAKAAISGDNEKAKQELTRCFDYLLDEKNNYYPVEPDLMDVVLTANTTVGKSFQRQLDVSHPTNILMTGSVIRKTFADQPESAEKLKSAIADDKVTIIGGVECELPETLLSTESLVNQIQLGRDTCNDLLDTEPTIFMRRRFGLTPATPGVLDQFNFNGAVHSTLDDGTFPQCSSSNVRWTGDDDRSVLAFGEIPLSAADSGAFVGLGVKLGEAIDSAHMASVVFVHWPDNSCDSFKDLMRIAEYSPLLGTFVDIEEYFELLYDPGYGETFDADEYKSPFLKQSVEQQSPGPISKYTSYWERFYKLSASRSLLVQVCARTAITAAEAKELQERIAQLQTKIESQLNIDEVDSGLDQEVDRLSDDISSLLKPKNEVQDSSSVAADSVKSVELVNTTNYKRRVEFDSSAFKSPSGTLKNDLPVVLCDTTGAGATWMVELPPMGSATVDLHSPQRKDVFKSDPKVADPEKRVLRNEFFEVQVHESNGGVRSIQLYNQRINLASQQLAMRIPAQRDARNQPLTRARYTDMVADKITVVAESRLAGTAVSTGRLMDKEKLMAEFEQTIRVTRGKPLIEFEINVEPKAALTSSFQNYICSRLAWKYESARIIANAQETNQQIASEWFHATNFMRIIEDDHSLTMLTGGLPYHRRASRRMVDSLLVVGKEQSRKFRFGLAVNIQYPLAAAIDFMSPAVEICSREESKNKTGWLFHFDCKNILATWWSPVFDDQQRWSGVQIRLRETEGRKGKLTISCPRDVSGGERVNFAGDFLQSIEVASNDKIELEFDRFEFFQISIQWKL
ncbi:MAG: hypothetical protein AB8B55_05905 [Mariniblastus sp.]